jgi:hypothetical protein
MTKTILTAVFMAAATFAATPAHAQSATEQLYNDCKANITLVDADPDDSRPKQQMLNLLAKSSYCSGYLIASEQLLTVAKVMCTADDLEKGTTLPHVFVRWIDEHPAERGKTPANAVMDAMMAAYPCKQ